MNQPHWAPPAGPPSQPLPETSPAVSPPGLVGILLDQSFDVLLTIRVVRGLYAVSLVCISGVSVAWFMIGWSLAAGRLWPALGWAIVIGAPVMWFASAMVARLALERLIAGAKQADDIKEIRETLRAFLDESRSPS